ncbi:O-antigen ligase family protein [uncultured Polaribacter sp.]|uniref:O-antigen ligase family protein n=1 Tax=uncultured Polaribacter sp. TaxID=174711 RepID=UPI00260F71F2|nr:O-antigen ligase family protein [uncultured Polaribacter sp.]
MATTSRIFMTVLQRIKLLSILDVLFILILVTLPLGVYVINSIAVAFFFVYAFYLNIKTKQGFHFSRLGYFFVALYILFVFSLIWTNNIENTRLGLERFLSYLILPITFALLHKSKINKNLVLKIFSNTLVLYAIYCISFGVLKVLRFGDKKFLFYHDLSGNLSQLNAIYLSVFTSLAICFLLFKEVKSKKDYIKATFLMLFLLLLSSKIIIATVFTIIGFRFFFTITKKINFKKWLLYLPFFLIIIALSSYKLSNRIKVEFQETNLSEVLETKDFGHVYLWTGFGLRAFQVKVFFEIVKEKEVFWLGLGLNNSQDVLKEKYKEYNLYPGFYYYNFHNQYLQVFAELGFIGLILLLSAFYIILRKAINTKDYFLLSFIILILVVCITESFLWRQRGMVCFIALALLLTKKNNYILD